MLDTSLFLNLILLLLLCCFPLTRGSLSKCPPYVYSTGIASEIDIGGIMTANWDDFQTMGISTQIRLSFNYTRVSLPLGYFDYPTYNVYGMKALHLKSWCGYFIVADYDPIFQSIVAGGLSVPTIGFWKNNVTLNNGGSFFGLNLNTQNGGNSLMPFINNDATIDPNNIANDESSIFVISVIQFSSRAAAAARVFISSSYLISMMAGFNFSCNTVTQYECNNFPENGYYGAYLYDRLSSFQNNQLLVINQTSDTCDNFCDERIFLGCVINRGQCMANCSASDPICFYNQTGCVINSCLLFSSSAPYSSSSGPFSSSFPYSSSDPYSSSSYMKFSSSSDTVVVQFSCGVVMDICFCCFCMTFIIIIALTIYLSHVI